MPKTDWNAHGSPSRNQPRPVPPAAVSAPTAADSDPTGAPKPMRKARARQQSPAPSATPGKRFVEPYPFTAEQRAAITAALADCDLGDDMAREIFIGAIAYDLAVLADALKPPQPVDQPRSAQPAGEAPPEPAARTIDPAATGDAAAPSTDAMQLLTEHARGLIDALGLLEDKPRSELAAALGATDAFRRSYGPVYLDALATELARVVAAADAVAHADSQRATPKPPHQRTAKPTPEGKQSPKPRAPRTSRASADAITLGFIRHAASVYEQCFDLRPDASSDAAFARALAAIGLATGIPISVEPKLLRQALQVSG